MAIKKKSKSTARDPSADAALYQAMLARDPRFDGKFFIGVKSTGIYCRPICPARPKLVNIEFFAHAQAAEDAGYRPCLRCRPESAPRSPAWQGKSAVVARALKLIASHHTLLDGNKMGHKTGDQIKEEDFAAKLGVSARHLRRLFEGELGRTPKQISDSMRLDFARQLLVETRMPVTEVAFASGFLSIRRFNDAIRVRFRRSPTQLRKNRNTGSRPSDPASSIRLNLAYRPPFDWASLLHYFESHLIEGVERIEDDIYERVFRIENSSGVFRVTHDPGAHQLVLDVTISDSRHLLRLVQNVRRMFDLDSDPQRVIEGFEKTPHLSELCSKFPGLRIPQGWDGFEASICVILGQLVSTQQARRLIGQLVEGYGESVTHPTSGLPRVLFPEPHVLAQSDLASLKTTGHRKKTIREFSRLVADGQLNLDSTQDPVSLREQLLGINGIGPWTIECISLRALGDTDAFPRTDLILKRALELRPKIQVKELSPWRAYAATYLWKEYAQSLSNQRQPRKARS